MVASGNDFIVVDNRRKIFRNAAAFSQDLCRPHLGIGADGVLLVEPSQKAEFKMRILNPDGSEAEACGNGFRCVARYAQKKLGLGAQFNFESKSGLISASLNNSRVCIKMIDPYDYRPETSVRVPGRTFSYYFINAGVPHAVIFLTKPQLEAMEVERFGRAVREHRKFKPKGTNVNFVYVADEHTVYVRTYERGVEAETLACGTGSTASAVVSGLAGFVKPPVSVHTRSGEVLVIGFSLSGTRVSQVTLDGEARFVYEGVWNGNARI